RGVALARVPTDGVGRRGGADEAAHARERGVEPGAVAEMATVAAVAHRELDRVARGHAQIAGEIQRRVVAADVSGEQGERSIVVPQDRYVGGRGRHVEPREASGDAINTARRSC